MKKLILFTLLILLYWFAEGATEGYTWADPDHRMENVIIKGGAQGNGILDYHSWRFLEVLGIYGATLIAILSIRNIRRFIWSGIGSMLVGMFIYERVLNYVNDGTIYKESGWRFYIGGIEIPRYFWQDITLLVIGLSLIVVGIIYNYKNIDN
ncbi:MAG: hypothetical protein MUP82_05630 [Candidatus Marinimicrobia bacterium]|nr:hypothetical protein [Candidatus Neomarinimicrobiota bacterium]